MRIVSRMAQRVACTVTMVELAILVAEGNVYVIEVIGADLRDHVFVDFLGACYHFFV